MKQPQVFEDLPIWKDSVALTVEVYNLCRTSKISKDYSLSDQIKRSLISISSNIAEGFERNNNKELVRFLLFAKGSAGEARSQLYLASQLGYIEMQTYTLYKDRFLSLSKQIKGFIRYLKEWQKPA